MERPSSWEERLFLILQVCHIFIFLCFILYPVERPGGLEASVFFQKKGTFHIFIFYFFIFQPVERPCVLEASGFFGGSLKPSCGIT